MSCVGHVQRGGNPCPYDRLMATRFGIEGASLIMNNDFGKLVVYKDNSVTAIPLIESAGKLKYVDVNSEEVNQARLLGISFGD